MKISVYLKKALALLGPNGENWIKGSYYFEGEYCMVGALRAVTIFWGTQEKMRDYLKRVIDSPSYFGNHMTVYNDAPERTFQEIKEVFQKAILLAEADEL